ncbi:MAG: peptidylprolyl isomerase [Phycisphaerales bacterium]|jgi:FKBP-type peptidyl-prolyl cis-trans isomerase SlyD|nr:peptidylprolyl isomerase [Phycisphaerales bacterium]
MQIDKNRVVSFDYTLTDDQGQMLDSSRGKEPLVYLHGVGGIIPGLEEAMQGKKKGEEFQIKIAPEKAYGPRDEALVQAVPRERFQGVENIHPGMQFQAKGSAGQRVVTVAKVDDQHVTVDANHPLAGVTLTFDVKIVEVRDATEEELSHGHAHAPGGHHH